MKPSILLLEATQGGVVNNAGVAARLAQVILESLAEPNGLLTNRPLQVENCNDRWSVKRGRSPVDPGRTDAYYMEIFKRDATIFLSSSDNSNQILLTCPSTVQKFAAIIIENARGKAELNRQLPLLIEDKVETWFVNGSGNVDRAVEGPGPCRLEIEKRDARVVDMWFEWILKTPPEAKALLRSSG
jgi:hypothetical protein